MRLGIKGRETSGGEREAWLPLVLRALRQITGAPDYERYIEHCRQAGHPVQLTEADYVKEFFERKGRTPRCC